MALDPEPLDAATRPRRPLLPLVALPLIAFLLGLAAMGWLLSRWDGGAKLLGVAPAPPPAIAQPVQTIAVEPEPAAPEAGPDDQEPERLIIDPEITRRVNRLEERLGALDTQSREAVGNADRAEGLLVAFAARRALDRGVPLGYIEGLLAQRFGERHRQSVARIITASRDPVTLRALQEGLQEIGPQLIGGGTEQTWWTGLKNELGGLITIRKAGTQSTVPAERLRRATRRLEAGEVDVALVEVSRLPGRGKASDWIAKARRYVGARQALDAIETAALLEPRNPAPARPAPVPAPAKAAPAKKAG
ncbi:MAG TPA: hypothetical protein VIT45_00600 [Allosphingosinicella sp.]